MYLFFDNPISSCSKNVLIGKILLKWKLSKKAQKLYFKVLSYWITFLKNVIKWKKKHRSEIHCFEKMKWKPINWKFDGVDLHKSISFVLLKHLIVNNCLFDFVQVLIIFRVYNEKWFLWSGYKHQIFLLSSFNSYFADKIFFSLSPWCLDLIDISLASIFSDIHSAIGNTIMIVCWFWHALLSWCLFLCLRRFLTTSVMLTQFSSSYCNSPVSSVQHSLNESDFVIL